MAKNPAPAPAPAAPALPFELEDVALPTGRSSGFTVDPNDPMFKMFGALEVNGKTFFVPAAAPADTIAADQRESVAKENASKLVNALRSKIKTFCKTHEGVTIKAVVANKDGVHGARVGRVTYEPPKTKAPAAPAAPAIPAVPAPPVPPPVAG